MTAELEVLIVAEERDGVESFIPLTNRLEQTDIVACATLVAIASQVNNLTQALHTLILTQGKQNT